MATVSLAEQAYEHIHQQVVAKHLLPGDILDRRVIAEQLGISVSPVVQAVARLELEGFVEVLPRRGTRIRVVREADFRAQMLVRNALECQAARVYRGRPVRDNETRLLALAENVDASREGDRINWPAEIAFHRALVELVDSPGFLAEYDRVMRVGQFVLAALYSRSNPFPVDPSRSWHSDLVGALQTTSADRAERAVRAHLEVGRRRLLGRPASKGDV